MTLIIVIKIGILCTLYCGGELNYFAFPPSLAVISGTI